MSAAAASGSWTLVFHESMITSDDGPHVLVLDTGVVYRLEAIGEPAAVLVAPVGFGPTGMPPLALPLGLGHTLTADPIPVIATVGAIRAAPIIEGRGMGSAFMVPTPGRYRIWVVGRPTTRIWTLSSYRGGTILVRVYQDASDQASLACVRNPQFTGCRGTTDWPGAGRGRVFAVLAIMAGVIGWMLGK